MTIATKLAKLICDFLRRLSWVPFAFTKWPGVFQMAGEVPSLTDIRNIYRSTALPVFTDSSLARTIFSVSTTSCR